MELAQTHRLLLAKQLLTETRLPIIEVAFASGFASVRRFNALFRSHYRLTPSRFRRSLDRRPAPASRCDSGCRYRPPLRLGSCSASSPAARSTGVEPVAGDAIARTVAIGPHRGWLRVATGRGAERTLGRARHFARPGASPRCSPGCAASSISTRGPT